MDDTTVEATGEERLAAALAPGADMMMDPPTSPADAPGEMPTALAGPRRVSAAALSDPRPTEAEVRQAWESRIRDADFWQVLAALGCFRPAATTVPAEPTNVRSEQTESYRTSVLVRRTRFVADYWREHLLASPSTAVMAHPLCMVLAALDGETDPVLCGIDVDGRDAFLALSPQEDRP